MTATHLASVAPAGDGSVPELLSAMIRGLQPTHVAAGAALVRQGEDSEAAYVLGEGTVKIVADTPYGSVPLATLTGPKLLGEIGALSSLPRTASIFAVSDLLVYVIPRERLLDFGRQNPTFLTSVIFQLGKQLEGMNRTLSLYSNALAALESREFDPRILDELANPSPQMAEFSAAFRKFAQEIVGKRRRQDELESAAIIQQSYLPQLSVLADVTNVLELYAYMRPARNVGGDFYDFFMLDDHRLAFSIGDVCGKGISAAMFMAVVMTIVRLSAREETDVAATVARANTLLSKDNPNMMFATAFYGVVNLRDGTLEYCNCGHNAPIILHGTGELTLLGETGVPLALFENRPPAARKVTLTPADRLVLFTDGVTEAMSPTQEEFSDDRLEESLRSAPQLSARQIVERIFHDVDAFARDAEQADDITCVVLRCLPRPLAR